MSVICYNINIQSIIAKGAIMFKRYTLIFNIYSSKDAIPNDGFSWNVSGSSSEVNFKQFARWAQVPYRKIDPDSFRAFEYVREIARKDEWISIKLKEA